MKCVLSVVIEVKERLEISKHLIWNKKNFDKLYLNNSQFGLKVYFTKQSRAKQVGVCFVFHSLLLLHILLSRFVFILLILTCNIHIHIFGVAA